MKVILAIDGGGSRTRCLTIDREGRVVDGSESGPSNHLLVSRDVVLESLREATAKLLNHSPSLRDQVACVSAGMAGVDYDGVGTADIEAVFREIGFTQPLITGDMVIAHSGALGGRPGILALAGTGSCILGIGPAGERVKVGGWGPVYGDEGSAYRIGQTALRAAARAFDGRGPETMLVHAVLSALELENFRETLSRVYVQKMEPRQIAALSRVAHDVAEAGDQVAQEILFQAGDELAEAVMAAIMKLNLQDSTPLVSYQGSVFEGCALVRERFKEVLKGTLSAVTITPPRFQPVIGAFLIGCESLGWQMDEPTLKALEMRVRDEAAYYTIS